MSSIFEYFSNTICVLKWSPTVIWAPSGCLFPTYYLNFHRKTEKRENNTQFFKNHSIFRNVQFCFRNQKIQPKKIDRSIFNCRCFSRLEKWEKLIKTNHFRSKSQLCSFAGIIRGFLKILIKSLHCTLFQFLNTKPHQEIFQQSEFPLFTNISVQRFNRMRMIFQNSYKCDV